MLEELAKKHYLFPLVCWKLDDFPQQGLILDVGGGGEGVIGRLRGERVLAVDYQMDELLEAPPGPRKIVMDARQLGFLDGTFRAASAFFCFMYLKGREDQQQVLEEIARVLRPGGVLHLWDVDLGHLPETDFPTYIVHLEYAVGDTVNRTGYGSHWPAEPRGLKHYRALAAGAGFFEEGYRRAGDTFYLLLRKE